jgi:hypothetical protein
MLSLAVSALRAAIKEDTQRHNKTERKKIHKLEWKGIAGLAVDCRLF